MEVKDEYYYQSLKITSEKDSSQCFLLQIKIDDIMIVSMRLFDSNRKFRPRNNNNSYNFMHTVTDWMGFQGFVPQRDNWWVGDRKKPTIETEASGHQQTRDNRAISLYEVVSFLSPTIRKKILGWIVHIVFASYCSSLSLVVVGAFFFWSTFCLFKEIEKYQYNNPLLIQLLFYHQH